MLALLILLVVVVHAHTDLYVDRGAPSFILDATAVNPRINGYEKASLPYSLYWHLTESPYSLMKTLPVFFPVNGAPRYAINATDLVAGEYVFHLYTSNLHEKKVESHSYTVTIRERLVVMDETSTIISILGILKTETRHILSWVLISYYKASVFTADLIRSVMIVVQYSRDKQGDSFDSPLYIPMWSLMDIDVSHYKHLIHTAPGRAQFDRVFTLGDYFARNNATHIYDLLAHYFGTV